MDITTGLLPLVYIDLCLEGMRIERRGPSAWRSSAPGPRGWCWPTCCPPGIESVVLECALARVRREPGPGRRARAGHGRSADRELGVGERLEREGLVHHGIELRFGGARPPHRLRRADRRARDHGLRPAGGRQGPDRGAARRRRRRSASRSRTCALDGIETDAPARRASARRRGSTSSRCDFIAGCDGFHGVCRDADSRRACSTVYERVYPFAWLGILAEAPPSTRRADLRLPRARLRPAQHALADDQPPLPPVRARRRRSRPGPTSASGHELRAPARARRRLASSSEGPILEKGITPMRSFVVEPMQYGRLFLAGDAAHIVPPTGAKGMNLAVADVRVLAEALAALVRRRRPTPLLDAYSATCLRRVWRAEHFSWWMTSMLHRFPDDDDGFERAAAARPARLRVPARGPPRRRWPRTTWGPRRSTTGRTGRRMIVDGLRQSDLGKRRSSPPLDADRRRRLRELVALAAERNPFWRRASRAST